MVVCSVWVVEIVELNKCQDVYEYGDIGRSLFLLFGIFGTY